MLNHSSPVLISVFLVTLGFAGCSVAASPTPSQRSAGSAQAGSASVAGSPEVARLQRVGNTLVGTIDSLKKNDVSTAKRSFEEFDDGWNAIEVYVKARAESLYGQIEDVQAKIDKQLLDSASPNAEAILPLVQQVQASYGEAITLAQSGPAADPVLDQLEELRDVRLSLRHTIAALRKGDLATAKTEYKKFDDRWDDVENYVKDRSRETYRDIETDMGRVSDALFKPVIPNAAESLPLAETLLARYNDALKLIAEGMTSA